MENRYERATMVVGQHSNPEKMMHMFTSKKPHTRDPLFFNTTSTKVHLSECDYLNSTPTNFSSCGPNLSMLVHGVFHYYYF